MKTDSQVSLGCTIKLTFIGNSQAFVASSSFSYGVRPQIPPWDRSLLITPWVDHTNRYCKVGGIIPINYENALAAANQAA